MLKIAVQKSERISKGFLDLLSKCGLKVENNNSKLYCKFNELPIELYFIRGSDVKSLMENKFDVAVLGEDSFLEYNLDKTARIVSRLDFARCKLSFASKYKNINLQDLNNKIIATSYSSILTRYLKENSIDAKIIEMNGSVESSIELGISDVIFDIVQTGSTLLEHGLIENLRAINLEAIMIANNKFSSEIMDKILFRINAVINGKSYKYIMFNIKKSLLDDIIKFLPSGKSPTIIDLENKNYVAIHTLCRELELWDVVEGVKKIGGEEILVTDVNLRFL